MAQQNIQQKLYTVVLELWTGKTKTVQIKASSEEVAIRRAYKHNPEATDVKSVS